MVDRMGRVALYVLVVICWHAAEATVLRCGIVSPGPAIGMVRGSVLGLFTVVWARRSLGPRWARSLGCRRPAPTRSAIACVVGLVAMCTWLHGPMWDGVAQPLPSVGAVLAVALYEELGFRGLVYAWLSRVRSRRAIAAGAAAFGLAHTAHLFYGVTAARTVLVLVVASGLGLVFGAARLFSRSVFVPGILHGYWNLSVDTSARSVSSEEYLWGTLALCAGTSGLLLRHRADGCGT
jgi:membrane protease YdiL (CAAX protease family)